ncbi:linear amide C-N hydrolase [Bacteroides cellulosilyticus]|uniref:linear amide C-N hydrolase n=1 Tax=Bacteroides cellulosilyticus TaxID=246787 RepID=UPI003977853C
MTEWMLSQFSSIDGIKEALSSVHVVGLGKRNRSYIGVFGAPSGRQVVLEIVVARRYFYENEVGVPRNAPGFSWQLTEFEQLCQPLSG